MTSKLDKLLYIFYLPPLFAFIAYLLGGTEATNTIFMLCNILSTLILITSLKDKVTKKICLVYFLYFIFVFFFYPQIEGSKMYLCTVLYTLIILLFFSSERINCIDEKSKKIIDKTILVFTLSLIICQLCTIENPLSFVRFNYDYIEENALEQKGFLISHAFGYYLAGLIIYYAYKRNLLIMLLCTIVCFFFTRRTNILLCGLGWFYYINNRYGVKYVIVGLIVLAIIIISYMGVTSYFENFAFSLDPTDADSAAFTSGRTHFWGSYIVYLQSGIMTLNEYLFGFGPASSRDFNETYSGLKVWMHNDFFDIAFCLGITGLILYIYVICKITKSLGYGILIFILISANLNGFMLYQIYPVVFIFAIIKEFTNDKITKISHNE